MNPDCALLMMKQFGKPRTCMPWNDLTPSDHFFFQALAAPPDDVVPRSPGVRGSDFETACVDQAVQLVLLAVDHDTFLRYAIHSLALRIHQRDVRDD